MKNTGMIRRIDDLGRIVLPVEIRNNLNIFAGDELELYLENNQIILKKHSYLLPIVERINHLIKLFESNSNMKIFISDREKIISNSELQNITLNQEHLNIIQNREDVYLSSKQTNFGKEGYFAYIPVIKNSDVIGLIILLKTSAYNSNDKFMVKIFKELLLDIQI